MVVWFEKLVCQGLLLVGEHSSTFLNFPGFCTEKAPAIGIGTFIVLDNPSGVSEVMVRMLIALDGPPEAGEGIIVLIEGHTPAEAVPGISFPMGIPPKPPDRVTVSIVSVHGEHLQR